MIADRRVILFACTLLAAVPARAIADTISFNSSFVLPAASGHDPNLSAVFFVPQFNPALGTLDAASYTVVRAGIQFSWAFDSEIDDPSTVTTAQAWAETSLHHLGGELGTGLGLFQLSNFINPGPHVPLSSDTDGAPDFAGSDAHTFHDSTSPDTVTDTIVDPFLLGAFTGSGAVPLELRVDYTTLFHITGCCSPPFNISLPATPALWFWQYEYTPAVIVDPGPGPTPVPEPATLSLLGLGAVALSLRHRRRILLA